jgi:hypothetical protein
MAKEWIGNGMPEFGAGEGECFIRPLYAAPIYDKQ